MKVNETLRDVRTHISWLKDEKERIKVHAGITGDELVLIDDLPSLAKQAQRPHLDRHLRTQQRAELKRELASARARVPRDLPHIAPSGGNSFHDVADVHVAFVGPIRRARELERLCHTHLFGNLADFLALAESRSLDFLLISAALVDDELTAFHQMGKPFSRSRGRLERLVAQAKLMDIPVVFETTLDTNHYDRFSSLAALCDYVFTANEERCADYMLEAGHDRVHVLRPGVDPAAFNPVGMTSGRRDAVLVTNSFPVHRFEKDLGMLARGVRDAGTPLLVLRERNEERLSSAPKDMRDALVLATEEETEALHRSCDWVLHTSEVKGSPTMSSSAIYEAQARGNLVITNYNVAVNNDFPNVFIATSALDAAGILTMFESADERYEHQLSGVRSIFSHHTTHDRFSEMLNVLGLEDGVRRDVLVIGRGDVDHLLGQFERQSYPHKTFMSESDVTESDLQGAAYVAMFDGRHTYLHHYLEDMINAFKYTDVAFVTKPLDTEPEHCHLDSYDDVARTVFKGGSVSSRHLAGSEALEGGGYAIDHFEWAAGSTEVVENPPAAYKMSVIVPIYNNGRYLYNKCFLSLRRSSMFKDMEILLVDDGSTDGVTASYIDRLVRKYPNVYAYSFGDGGSGSASRPRNQGVALASTPLIAFLDPDNEAVNDGYAELYRIMSDDSLDLAVGSMLKLGTREAMVELNELEPGGVRVVEDPRAYLLDHNFKVQSIQTMVIRRSFLEENRLEQVVGAVGQDSLFFQEMFLRAGRVALVDLTIHDYYAAVAGSTVNTITKRYFEKCVIRETARARAFAREGVLDAYRETRFEHFFERWYLVFLRRSRPEDFFDNAGLLHTILEQYQPLELAQPIVRQFVELYEAGRMDELKRVYFDAYL